MSMLELLPLKDAVGLAAAACTIAGATMTASNQSARITGWGFAVMAAGSVLWIALAAIAGATNLMAATFAFLVAINIFGAWNWTGRIHLRERAASVAARRGRTVSAPTLFPLGSLVGMTARTGSGVALGTVVEAMMRCNEAQIDYLVLNDARTLGFGEMLRAVDGRLVRYTPHSITILMSEKQFLSLPTVDQTWPVDVL